MKKAILIDHEPWTIRRKQLFYDLFDKAGVPLAVWDLSQWLYPGMTTSDVLPDEPYLTKIKDKDQFFKLLRECDPKDTVIVEEIFRNWDHREIFKEIYLLHLKTIKIELYGNTNLEESLKDKFRRLFSKNFTSMVKVKLNLIRLSIYSKYNGIGRPFALFSSNAKSWRTNCLNHPDYELYKFSNGSEIVKGDYIVFSDVFFPLHPDIKYFHGVKKEMDARHYQNIMTEYFDYLENKYKMPVIIAAHPKATYKGNEFGNRKIIKYKTCDLIRNCKFVTMHFCNSTSFAVLADKPIAYVFTNDYLCVPSHKRGLYLLVEKILGLKPYNLEKNYKDEFKFSKIDNEKRDSYIYSYLTSKETEDKANYLSIREYFETP